MKPVARLPPSSSTRKKISKSLTGRVRPDSVKAAISASMKGVPKSPEHRAKIAAARRARPPRDVIGDCKRIADARRRLDDNTRLEQWHRDLMKAYHLGDRELLHDIRRSGGFRALRKIFHPDVSDGYRKLRHRGYGKLHDHPQLRLYGSRYGRGAGT